MLKQVPLFGGLCIANNDYQLYWKLAEDEMKTMTRELAFRPA